MKTAVKVDKISKIYRIGLEKSAQDTFGGALIQIVKSPFRNYRKYRSLYRFMDINPEIDLDAQEKAFSDIIWALKSVSFEADAGEVLGIIGPNGAGKSTLLKILSRITDPTTGYAEIRGKVSSLLEVGTGFHPELTGRDNVYLNGTILGMKKKEIESKFDEIVSFSGVEKFIDTPVKRYSSGMKVRLAFSVAAHLEPEILIIDEVLAVGDADFQTKCLNKMEGMGQEGRTVLFVSHNMEAVTRLCNRAIMLEGGKVVKEGTAHEVVSSYLNANFGTTSSREWNDPAQAPGNSIARLRALRARNQEGEIVESYDIRHPINLEMEFDVYEGGHVLLPHFSVWDSRGQCAFITVDVDPEWRRRERPPGKYISKAWIPGNFLTEGMTYISANCRALNPDSYLFGARLAIAFNVFDSFDGDSARGDYAKNMAGVVRPLLKWTTEYRANAQDRKSSAESDSLN